VAAPPSFTGVMQSVREKERRDREGLGERGLKGKRSRYEGFEREMVSELWGERRLNLSNLLQLFWAFPVSMYIGDGLEEIALSVMKRLA